MTIRVLLVDSHEMLHAALVEAFEDSDIRIHWLKTVTCESLAAVAEDDNVDLVLLDVKLHGGGGLAALEKIRSCQPDWPVLIYTLQDRPDIVERCRQMGVSGYLIKGVSKFDLLRAIREICAGQEFWPSTLNPSPRPASPGRVAQSEVKHG